MDSKSEIEKLKREIDDIAADMGLYEWIMQSRNPQSMEYMDAKNAIELTNQQISQKLEQIACLRKNSRTAP